MNKNYGYFGRSNRPMFNGGVSIEYDKMTPLQTQPHYTDKRFDKPRIVFGKDIKGLAWDYDDRIWQWNYAKHESSWEYAVKNSGAPLRSARFYEVYLSQFFDCNIVIYCIQAGVNLSNGYPYVIFGYKRE